MGDVAVITTKRNFEKNGVGVYLHWDGDRASVEAFLKFCELRGYRPPNQDDYGWSYLAATICNYFGNGMSCGVDTLNYLNCDNKNNGVYIIENWKIVDRKFAPDDEEASAEERNAMLHFINSGQPKHMRLSKEILKKYPLSEGVI